MILTDTGPLVAILDRRDPYHQKAAGALYAFGDEPLLTTTPCLGEALYMLGAAGGYSFQAELWEMRRRGDLLVHELTPGEIDRAAALMEKYNDAPMDFGDASLISVAETRSLRKVFTLDHHFLYYRLADGSVLESIPGR